MDGWKNFFTNAKSWLAEADMGGPTEHRRVKESSGSVGGLVAELEQAKKEVEAALVNSFDTPRAMLVILKLVNATNVYLKDHKDSDNLAEVEAIGRWITKMVGIFGLDAHAHAPYDGLGWASAMADGAEPEQVVEPYAAVLARVRDEVERLSIESEALSAILTGQDPAGESRSLASGGCREAERLALPYLRTVSQARDELRRMVATQPAATKKGILALTDRIRDEDLTQLGVYLDDRPDNQPSLIKFIPAAELLAAREEKAAREADKAKKKEEARRAREAAEAEARERAKVAPEALFRGDDRYRDWDEHGLPTRMKDGSEVPKSQLKALKKLWEKQRRLHDEAKARGEL